MIFRFELSDPLRIYDRAKDNSAGHLTESPNPNQNMIDQSAQAIVCNGLLNLSIGVSKLAQKIRPSNSTLEFQTSVSGIDYAQLLANHLNERPGGEDAPTRLENFLNDAAQEMLEAWNVEHRP